jgi:hypothetical protein
MPLFALPRVSGVPIATFTVSEKLKLKSIASLQTVPCWTESSSGPSQSTLFFTFFFWASRWKALGDQTSDMFL